MHPHKRQTHPHERQTRQFGMPQDNIRVQRDPPKRIRGHLGLPREHVSLPRDSATRIANHFRLPRNHANSRRDHVDYSRNDPSHFRKLKIPISRPAAAHWQLLSHPHEKGSTSSQILAEKPGTTGWDSPQSHNEPAEPAQ